MGGIDWGRGMRGVFGLKYFIIIKFACPGENERKILTFICIYIYMNRDIWS